MKRDLIDIKDAVKEGLKIVPVENIKRGNTNCISEQKDG